MKYFTCAFGLLFLLLSNVVSAGLLSWPSQTFSQSRYVSASEGPNIRIAFFEIERSMLRIDSVRFTPENTRPGDELTVEVVGFLHEPIYDNTSVKVEIMVGSEAPIERKYELCNELLDNKEHAPFQCPIPRGPIAFKQKIRLGEIIPEDKIHITVSSFIHNLRLLTFFVIIADFSPESNKYLELSD